MIRRNPPFGPRAGLSLFELLLSLALLALIAAALSASLSLGLRLYERADRSAPELDALTLRLQLRHWLDRAAPPHLLTPVPIDFEGAPDRLEFTTLAETPFAPEAAALRIELFLQEETLALSIVAMDHEGGEITRWRRSLATDAAGLRIWYLQAGDPPGKWQDTWAYSTTLPALIRIELDPGSTPDWPELSQRPRYAE